MNCFSFSKSDRTDNIQEEWDDNKGDDSEEDVDTEDDEDHEEQGCPRTYAARAVVRWIDRTYRTCGEKNWIFFFKSIFISLSPLSTEEVPSPKLIFFRPKK